MHNAPLNCTAVAFTVVLILRGGGGTVPQPKGDSKFLKGGPKGEPILSKKGTKRGTKRHKRGPKIRLFSELCTKSEYAKIVKSLNGFMYKNTVLFSATS